MSVFTPKMIAERWHCSVSAVRKIIATGELKSFKIGRKMIRVTAEELLEWEKRNSRAIGEDTSSQSAKAVNENAIRSARLTSQRPRYGSPNLIAFDQASHKADP